MYNLQVESLGRMPFDDLVSLYRQGYKLSEPDGRVNIGKRINIGSLATCGTNTVQIGGMLTLSASASIGTPPYTYHWSIKKPDGSIDTTLAGEINQYTFSNAGDYTISVFVTDSCPGGVKTSQIQTCTVTATTGGGDGGDGGDLCSGITCNDRCYGVNLYSQICNPNTGGCIQGVLKQSNVIQCGGDGGGGGDGGITCPSTDEIPIFGKCYKKNTVYIGAAAGVVLLLVLSK